jgi:hypothetical protein
VGGRPDGEHGPDGGVNLARHIKDGVVTGADSGE